MTNLPSFHPYLQTIEAARRGFKSYGVELNTWLVLYSRFAAWRQGLGHTATFMKKDLWKVLNNIVYCGIIIIIMFIKNFKIVVLVLYR